jgi:hypothetical protein
MLIYESPFSHNSFLEDMFNIIFSSKPKYLK